ncbi:MAG: hypothetical protein ABI305_06460 [Tepidiformaceae bacterium]
MPAVTLRLLEAESGEDFGHLTDEAQALLSGGEAPSAWRTADAGYR